MELARVIHHIFSALDESVRNMNFFKMDTVGDAYIISAWLPHEPSNPQPSACEGQGKGAREAREGDAGRPEGGGLLRRASAQELCHRMLWLAGDMLDTVRANRMETGERISVRIGIGMGTVVVGALGSLQPRVHLRGDAMREAERLEQDGTPGMVHVGEEFLR